MIQAEIGRTDLPFVFLRLHARTLENKILLALLDSLYLLDELLFEVFAGRLEFVQLGLGFSEDIGDLIVFGFPVRGGITRERMTGLGRLWGWQEEGSTRCGCRRAKPLAGLCKEHL